MSVQKKTCLGTSATHHWLGAPLGRQGLGSNLGMDFRTQQLGPSVSYTPHSSSKHILIASTECSFKGNMSLSILSVYLFVLIDFSHYENIKDQDQKKTSLHDGPCHKFCFYQSPSVNHIMLPH